MAGSKVYANSEAGEQTATVDFSKFSYRFKPFSVFGMAIRPAIYMFLSSLFTLAVLEVSGGQIGPMAGLIILVANGADFASVSRVQAFQTRTVI